MKQGLSSRLVWSGPDFEINGVHHAPTPAVNERHGFEPRTLRLRPVLAHGDFPLRSVQASQSAASPNHWWPSRLNAWVKLWRATRLVPMNSVANTSVVKTSIRCICGGVRPMNEKPISATIRHSQYASTTRQLKPTLDLITVCHYFLNFLMLERASRSMFHRRWWIRRSLCDLRSVQKSRGGRIVEVNLVMRVKCLEAHPMPYASRPASTTMVRSRSRKTTDQSTMAESGTAWEVTFRYASPGVQTRPLAAPHSSCADYLTVALDDQLRAHGVGTE